jgi:hypothetical protein
MVEATTYFRPMEQRMHRQFDVDAALQVRQRLKLTNSVADRMMPSDGAWPSHGAAGARRPGDPGRHRLLGPPLPLEG